MSTTARRGGRAGGRVNDEARIAGTTIRTCAEAVDGSGGAEERLANPLLLQDEDRVALREAREAVDGGDAGTCDANQGTARAGL
jgi:hypothetical protein